MRRFAFILFFMLAGTALTAFAQNQQPANLQPIEDGAPVLSAGDAALEPEVTIRREGTNQIREFRINGRLYKMEIQPENAPAYVLVDPRGEGQWMKIDSNEPLIVPQWVLIRF